MADETPKIALADALAEIRREISRARQEGAGKDVRFAAKSIEVELFVDFSVQGRAEVKAPGWLPFSAAAEGSAQRAGGHRIRIVLEIDPDGAPSDRLISDSTGPAPVTSGAQE